MRGTEIRKEMGLAVANGMHAFISELAITALRCVCVCVPTFYSLCVMGAFVASAERMQIRGMCSDNPSALTAGPTPMRGKLFEIELLFAHARHGLTQDIFR